MSEDILAWRNIVIIVLATWIIVMPWLAVKVGRWLRDRPAEPLPDNNDVTKDLGEPINRIRLQTMLTNYGLHGSVNVRDGQVFPYANAEGRSGLSTHMFQQASRFENQNLEVCVQFGGKWVPLDLTLADLKAAAFAMDDV